MERRCPSAPLRYHPAGKPRRDRAIAVAQGPSQDVLGSARRGVMRPLRERENPRKGCSGSISPGCTFHHEGPLEWR